MAKNGMDILIISDTHGDARRLERLMKQIAPRFDMTLFLGDGIEDLFIAGHSICPTPLYCVTGNCDEWRFFQREPEIEGYGRVSDSHTLDIMSHKIFMCHGHKFDVKSTLVRLSLHGLERGADILLFGHTHEAFEGRAPREGIFSSAEGPIYLFNPGALRDGSFGTLTIRENGVLFGYGRI